MQEETGRAITTAISVITSVAIIVIMLTALSVGRKGYSILEWNEGLHDKMQCNNKYMEYSQDLTADAVINFIATYGDKFKYTCQDTKTSIIFSWNMPEERKAEAKAKMDTCTGVSNTINTSKVLSKIPVELIEQFKDEILSDRKYMIVGYSAEWEQLDIKDLDNCLYINIIIKEG